MKLKLRDGENLLSEELAFHVSGPVCFSGTFGLGTFGNLAVTNYRIVY